MIHSGNPTRTLVPESTTHFRIAPDRGLVSFQLDEAGAVAGLTLHKQADIFAARVPAP